MTTAVERVYSAQEVGEFLLEVVREPGAYVAQLLDSRAHEVRQELWDLNRIQNLAQDILDWPFEFFPGHHNIARQVLTIDLPRKRQRLNADLHILEFGTDRMRRDFVLGDDEARERMIMSVIRRGGIYHRRGFDRTPVWVELVA
jgi:hypothetical protein